MDRRTVANLLLRRSFASRTSATPKPSTTAETAESIAQRTHNASIRKARKYSPAVGFVAGIFGSMIGVGGGVLMNPMILSMCKTIPQRVLTGTSLGAVVSTALASGSVFMSHASVDVGSAALIAVSAILTAPIGARMTSRLDCRQLRKILAYFLFGAAPLVPLKAVLSTREDAERGDRQQIGTGDEQGRRDERNESEQNQGILFSVRTLFEESPLAATQMLLIGATSGCLSGLLGIGGGTLTTPLLALTTNLDHSVILGTSMTGMIAPSIVGLIQHWRLGHVDPRLLAGLVIGTGAGGFAGSKVVVSPDLPPGSLETLFSLGMLFLGRKTLQSISK